jgi:hypothetical protein
VSLESQLPQKTLGWQTVFRSNPSLLRRKEKNHNNDKKNLKRTCLNHFNKQTALTAMVQFANLSKT